MNWFRQRPSHPNAFRMLMQFAQRKLCLHRRISMEKRHILSSCHTLQPYYFLITLQIHFKYCYQNYLSDPSFALLCLFLPSLHRIISSWPQLCSSSDISLRQSISTLPSFLVCDKFHNSLILQNNFFNLFYHFAFKSIPLILVQVPELSPSYPKFCSSQASKILYIIVLKAM